MRIVRFISLATALILILSISAFAADPVITAQPQSIFLPSMPEMPYTARFSIMATGDDLTYQWQVSSDNGSSWSNISNSTAVTPNLVINPVSQAFNGGRVYRCIVTGSDGQSSVSSVVSINVGIYIMETIPQMLVWGNEVINSIFAWVVSACGCIIDTPLLLIGVSFFALGASIAILSRLLSRS